MSNNKEKKCKCRGLDPECKICEGTGVILYDEEYDVIHDAFSNDETYFNEIESE